MVPRKEPKNEGLGLKLQDRPKGGVIVVEVVPQGAASKAELQADDVITEIDGKALSNAASALQLLESFLAVPVSDPKAKKTLLINLDRKGRKTFTSMERPK